MSVVSVTQCFEQQQNCVCVCVLNTMRTLNKILCEWCIEKEKSETARNRNGVGIGQGIRSGRSTRVARTFTLLLLYFNSFAPGYPKLKHTQKYLDFLYGSKWNISFGTNGHAHCLQSLLLVHSITKIRVIQKFSFHALKAEMPFVSAKQMEATHTVIFSSLNFWSM